MVGLNGVERAIDLSMKQTFKRYVFYSYNPLKTLPVQNLQFTWMRQPSSGAPQGWVTAHMTF